MQYPIPTRLNLLIILLCTLAFFGLLIAGTYLQTTGVRLLLAISFSIVMIPVYSLMHEAAHNTLHPDEKVNLYLGRWLCCLFIIPFTFYRHCHQRHHKKNRTDEEMWDLYYEHQSKWLRYGNLYGMMLGLGYLASWLSVLLLMVFPAFISSGFFKRHNEIRGFLEGFTSNSKLRTAQLESIGIVLFQAFIFLIIKPDLSMWLIFYLVHGFVWSSQNYVNHAFSPRDIINGGHNLRMPSCLRLIYLNFNVHLAHHRHPNIPWLHLPAFIRSGTNRIGFFKNYLRLWKGPVLTKQSSPESHNLYEEEADVESDESRNCFNIEQ